MNHSLRIVVAEDESDMREYLENTLPLLGHHVVGTARTGEELVQLCRQTHPDLVLTDIKMPKTDGIDAARQVYEERAVPIILMSAYHDDALIERAEAEHVMGYLVKPVREANLAPAISLAMRRFELYQAARKEAADLRQALQDRKLIERAKGIMMKRADVGEEEAFRRLQRMASDKRRKLVEIAQAILTAEESFQHPLP